MTDFQKEAITSIREITLQLILICVGVYAFVGGMISSIERVFVHRWALATSFSSFAASIAFGLLVYGAVIFRLADNTFTSGEAVGLLARFQWGFFFGGGPPLIWFLFSNMKK